MTPPPGRTDGMRDFWDESARQNAAWYVDTSLAYDDPDMARFFENGRGTVQTALVDAPVRPEGRALAVEVGPGLGRVCVALAEHFDRVVGVDISEEMLARARSLVDDPRIEFVLGDGITLPFEDASVDFVTSFTVLQHMPNRQLVVDYVTEAARIVRPGGVLALQWNNLPKPWRWKVQAAWWRTQQRLRVGQRGERRIAPQFAGTRVPWEPVRAAIEGAGLRVVGRANEGQLEAWVWATR